ncbi:sigma-70 family RNA polymerase sigma factor [Acholeplasma equirhinis]|uniref:sigma-70 family RNA polymerase sigma factor n=1 Tax=Acholeplasma equirhinis TaxID=555393 RepID=UPI00197AC51C|nr:sigma-70 family RNA polymerase sigma factor [Acholeplasma equirhinis]MBN3490238.1 sigma-70 family RNA polymerase sigma factor [Acholeplasma equirhinis]
MEQYESMINKVIQQFGSLSQDMKEDIKQELRMYIFQNQVDFEYEALEVNPFMFIALKRKFINLLKHSKYRKYQSLNEVTDAGDEYIDLISSSEMTEEDVLIDKSMILDYVNKHLKKKDKDILLAYFYQNMTYKAIGKKYGVSADTMRRRIQKILDEIRRRWQ